MKSNEELINRILELELTIKEAISVFDRETHQIETSFPEFTAMQRMKRAIGVSDMKNIRVKSVARTLTS